MLLFYKFLKAIAHDTEIHFRHRHDLILKKHKTGETISSLFFYLLTT
jgi:hypothetical protein